MGNRGSEWDRDLSRDPRPSETEPELETRTPDAQSGGLFLTVGYRPPFCPGLVPLVPSRISLGGPCLYACVPRSFFWRCRLFYSRSRSFLLFPPPADLGVLYSGQPLSCFSICPERHLGLPPLCICSHPPPFFLALFLPQILWVLGKMQRSCSPWSFRPWRWGRWWTPGP